MPRPRVVVGLLSEDQEFRVMQAVDAKEAAGRLGLDLEVVFAEGNPVVQIQQLFHFIHARDVRPVALVVEATTGEGLERVARNAVKAGIGWPLVNTEVGYLDELRRQHPELPIAALGGDGLPAGGQQHVEAGFLAATVVIPSNTGPALELVATWLQDRKPLAAEVLLAPSSFPPEPRLVARTASGVAARAATPAP